jgi:hypothetical protein
MENGAAIVGVKGDEHVREVTWRALVGVAAGATAGLLVAGVGGRLAMLLLRLTSPDSVRGALSDDGFEIGVVTTDTLAFLLGMAFAGSLVGVGYTVVRAAIPARARRPLWTLVGAAVGGATVIHSDGIDFTLLEPATLAVALFVAIPAGVSWLGAVLVERWGAAPPWPGRWRSAAVLTLAALGTFGVAAGVLAGIGAIGARRLGLAGLVLRVGRVAVPVVLVAIVVAGTVDVVRDAIRIL